MPHYAIRNPLLLRRLLWLDTALGSTNATAWLLFPAFWAALLGLPGWLIVAIACVNVVYAGSALALALQVQAAARLVRMLVLANWFWVAVSVGLLCWHFAEATVWGQAFLVMQVLGVGLWLGWKGGNWCGRDGRYTFKSGRHTFASQPPADRAQPGGPDHHHPRQEGLVRDRLQKRVVVRVVGR